MRDQSDDTNPLQPLNPETFARYAVHDRREILQLLNALIEKRVLLTAYVDRGPSFITVALAVTPDGGSLIIDASPDEALTARAGNAAQVVCTTRLDNVRLQFALVAPACTVYENRPALCAAIPDSILRLQRREYFRLSTPQSDPLICSIAQELPDGRKKSIPVRILDISGGGLAIAVPPDDISFEPGAEFSQCSLKLPDGEPLAVRLKVRNLFQVERPNGVKVMRAGCEFIGLSSQMTARIQRYMFKLERERKTREPG
ncbi:flagellar brake protein [Aromatoleum diolicum]|uniref:Flagellar brake protein YcgR n=1 Tax=Aromatoleum diolicum TaxID=75796 RepID=A0ABX1QDC8_9RHOO|nr:flagellar brake protein [Aromatoleum diolicum]NMG76399.1 flagellar brake protein [Aromatoleum diolicum]